MAMSMLLGLLSGACLVVACWAVVCVLLPLCLLSVLLPVVLPPPSSSFPRSTADPGPNDAPSSTDAADDAKAPDALTPPLSLVRGAISLVPVRRRRAKWTDECRTATEVRLARREHRAHVVEVRRAPTSSIADSTARGVRDDGARVRVRRRRRVRSGAVVPVHGRAAAALLVRLRLRLGSWLTDQAAGAAVDGGGAVAPRAVASRAPGDAPVCRALGAATEAAAASAGRSAAAAAPSQALAQIALAPAHRHRSFMVVSRSSYCIIVLCVH